MNTVVVYPYIVPDAGWLKLAALCWDKVYRLTSRKAPADPEGVEEFNHKLGGFLESLYPENYRVTHDFKSWLMHGGTKLSTSATAGHPSNYFAMFDDKLPTEGIADYLVKHNLLRARGAQPKGSAKRIATRASSKGNILVREDIALHYLSMAAASVAADKNADLFAESQEFTLSPIFYTARVLQANVAARTLEAYVPHELSKLPLAQIADIRSHMGEARLKYQSDIQSVCQEFTKVASAGELKNLERRITDVAKQRIESTRKAYALVKLNVVTQAIGLSCAPLGVLTWVGSALGIGILAPASILAGLALGGAKLLIDREKGKLEKEKGGWSYALAVEAKL